MGVAGFLGAKHANCRNLPACRQQSHSKGLAPTTSGSGPRLYAAWPRRYVNCTASRPLRPDNAGRSSARLYRFSLSAI